LIRTAEKYLPIKEANRLWTFLKSYQRWQKVIFIACSYFRIWHSLHSWKETVQRLDNCGNTHFRQHNHSSISSTQHFNRWTCFLFGSLSIHTELCYHYREFIFPFIKALSLIFWICLLQRLPSYIH
jgi:hypothetical protein